MNYNPFLSNPLLGQQLPTSYMSGPSGTQYGFGTTGFRQNYGFGQSRVSPLSMQDLSASQKSEFERLGGLQNLQTGRLQQQSSEFDLAQKRRQAEMDRILAGETFQGQTMSRQAAERSLYGQQYLRNKEMGELDLEMKRQQLKSMYGIERNPYGIYEKSRSQSGSSWSSGFSIPSFPSMG